MKHKIPTKIEQQMYVFCEKLDSTRVKYYVDKLYYPDEDVKDLPYDELKTFLIEVNKMCKLNNNCEGIIKNSSLLILLLKIRKQVADKYKLTFCDDYEFKYLADVGWDSSVLIPYEDRYVTPEELPYFCTV